MKTNRLVTGLFTKLRPMCGDRPRRAAAALTLTASLLLPAGARAADIAFPSAVYEPASHSLIASLTGADGRLYENYWNGTKWLWRPEETPPGVALEGINSAVYQSGIHAISPIFDAFIAFFANDSKGNVWAGYDAGADFVWEDLGNPGVPVDESDAVSSSTPRTLVDFVAGSGNGHLYDVYLSGGKWLWEDQGKPPGTTVEWAPGGGVYQPSTHTLFVFVTGANGHVYDKYWTGSKWAWEDQGRPPGTTAILRPTSVMSSAAPNPIKLYVTGANGHLFEKYGTVWKDLGKPPTTAVQSAPYAVYQPTSHPYTVFVVGANGHLFDTYYNESTWQWEDQGVPPGDVSASASSGLSPVYTMTPVGMNLAVFTVGTATRDLYVKYWDGTKGWTWQDQGRP